MGADGQPGRRRIDRSSAEDQHRHIERQHQDRDEEPAAPQPDRDGSADGGSASARRTRRRAGSPGETVAFVGGQERAAIGVYVLGAGDAAKISSAEVDDDLASLTDDELAALKPADRLAHRALGERWQLPDEEAGLERLARVAAGLVDLPPEDFMPAEEPFLKLQPELSRPGGGGVAELINQFGLGQMAAHGLP